MSSSGAQLFGGNKSLETFYGGADITIPANVDTEIISLTIPAGKWKITAQILPYTDGVVMVPIDTWIGPDSGSHAASYAASSAVVGSLAAGTTYDFALMTYEANVTFAVATTVYLNVAASATGVKVTGTSYIHSIPNVTGITAIPIA